MCVITFFSGRKGRAKESNAPDLDNSRSDNKSCSGFFFPLLLSASILAIFVCCFPSFIKKYSDKWLNLRKLNVNRITSSSWLDLYLLGHGVVMENALRSLFIFNYIILPCHLLATVCCQRADMVRNFRVQLFANCVIIHNNFYYLSSVFLTLNERYRVSTCHAVWWTFVFCTQLEDNCIIDVSLGKENKKMYIINCSQQ